MMYADKDGGHFNVYRSDGKFGIEMFADKDGGSLNIFNRDAEAIWTAP